MAVYDLEEQEKLDDLKAWWEQNAKYVTAAIVVVALIVTGVQGWRWYQRTQAEQASVLYQAVSQAARTNDVAKASRRRRSPDALPAPRVRRALRLRQGLSTRDKAGAARSCSGSSITPPGRAEDDRALHRPGILDENSTTKR
jgi:hypothetical protein